MCHISREKMSIQQFRSAPKTRPIVYKTYVILQTPLRHPAIEWWQSAMNLITPLSKEGTRAYYSVWHCICKFTHVFKSVKKKTVYFVQKANRYVPPPSDDRYVTECVTALARESARIQINNFQLFSPTFFWGGGGGDGLILCVTLYTTKPCQVKSSHLYLYSAFNNTNCNKALHNIKIGKFCQ